VLEDLSPVLLGLSLVLEGLLPVLEGIQSQSVMGNLICSSRVQGTASLNLGKLEACGMDNKNIQSVKDHRSAARALRTGTGMLNTGSIATPNTHSDVSIVSRSEFGLPPVTPQFYTENLSIND
jgi:hypothetical protein